jgi:hypothetical protein
VIVAIAGSRRLPAGQAPRLLVRFLAALPDDAVILLRKGAYTEPGRFERDVENLCSILRMYWEWCVPAPTEDTVGRAAVFYRDIEMVERADLVLLFFDPVEAHDGYSGTAHLMDKALDAARPVYAYAVAANGEVSRVGEYDPDHLYADIVPSA